ncbi:no significant blast hit, weak hit to transposase [Histoplasma capsulatum var. duboisii H88]|uniref:No significant blast hit, weak hit to transposase n=1 Tax=Ajellomyces capsulatus (strain H88) TaxID=544711 RepID=A0A8A1M0M9_AJEC8|nr:no significant blast hit, weak hit to transposase [Histoplasma capsulatum var. duboisii H88]
MKVVKNTIQPGVFEESKLEESSTRFRLLARVLISEIADSEQVLSSVRSVVSRFWSQRFSFD